MMLKCRFWYIKGLCIGSVEGLDRSNEATIILISSTRPFAFFIQSQTDKTKAILIIHARAFGMFTKNSVLYDIFATRTWSFSRGKHIYPDICFKIFNAKFTCPFGIDYLFSIELTGTCLTKSIIITAFPIF